MASKSHFDTNTPKIGNYYLGNTLGHGTFGKVKGKDVWYHLVKIRSAFDFQLQQSGKS